MCLKQMDSLQGGFTGSEGSVERWLSTLFATDPNQPTNVVEQPGNLQFVAGDTTEQETFARNSMYSFGKIRQAFFLHKICRTVPEKESMIKALADNFLVNAYASWNLPASRRGDFLRLQSSLFQQNSQISEAIGTLPFCSMEDPSMNEVFEVASLRSERIDLQQKIQQLVQGTESLKQLLNVAAEDKMILTQALNTARSSAQAAIDSVRETDLKRYKQLQASTDFIVAEKNAELQQLLDDARRNMNMFQKDRDAQVLALEETIRRLSKDVEEKVKEQKVLASKDLEIAKGKYDAAIAAHDQEFNISMTGKLNALAATQKNELANRDAKINASMDELRSANKSLDEVRKEFAMLATQAGAMRQQILNLEEGIELREREIGTLRNRLEDTRVTNASKVQALDSQVVNLTLQMSSKTKQFDSEVAALRSQAQAACAEDVARLARQADERHSQAIASIKAATEARIAEISRSNASQQMALRHQFEALQANDGGSGCTIV